MPSKLRGSIFVLVLSLAPGAALAQAIEVGPGGVRIDPGHHERRREVIEEHRHIDHDAAPVVVERHRDRRVIEEDSDHGHRRVIIERRHQHDDD